MNLETLSAHTLESLHSESGFDCEHFKGIFIWAHDLGLAYYEMTVMLPSKLASIQRTTRTYLEGILTVH